MLGIPVAVYCMIIHFKPDLKGKWLDGILLALLDVLYVPVTIQLVLMLLPASVSSGTQMGFMFVLTMLMWLFSLPLPQLAIILIFLLLPAITGALLMTQVGGLRRRHIALRAVLMYLYVLLFWVIVFLAIFLVLLMKNLIGSILSYFLSIYKELQFRLY